MAPKPRKRHDLSRMKEKNEFSSRANLVENEGKNEDRDLEEEEERWRRRPSTWRSHQEGGQHPHPSPGRGQNPVQSK